MTYIYRDSFRPPPPASNYADGRHLCDRALKKLFAKGPQRPGSLAKRAKPDADINRENALRLTKQERRLRSNAPDALEKIKKIHARGHRPGLPEHEAIGEAPFNSKSIAAVRKAQADAVHVDGHRMLSARELNKAFADSIGKVEVNLDRITRHRGHASEFRAMSKLEKRAFRKGLTGPALHDVGVKPPNSLNGSNTTGIKDTGATNDWRDQPVPNVKPTIVGGQPITTPSASNRDAALEAVKRALAKPQKMWGNNSDMDEDDTLDLDEDDDEDGDDDDSKDANRDDAFDTNPNKRKRRANQDDDE